MQTLGSLKKKKKKIKLDFHHFQVHHFSNVFVCSSNHCTIRDGATSESRLTIHN